MSGTSCSSCLHVPPLDTPSSLLHLHGSSAYSEAVHVSTIPCNTQNSNTPSDQFSSCIYRQRGECRHKAMRLWSDIDESFPQVTILVVCAPLNFEKTIGAENHPRGCAISLHGKISDTRSSLSTTATASSGFRKQRSKRPVQRNAWQNMFPPFFDCSPFL